MNNWITVITFTYPSEAHMAQGFLESEGVESILKDEMTAQVNNFYSNAIGGVKIQVIDKDYENALSILKKGGYIEMEKKAEVEVVSLDESTDINHCPFCHSDNIGKKKVPGIWTLFVSLILTVIFPIFKKTNICYDCGKEWTFKKQ